MTSMSAPNDNLRLTSLNIAQHNVQSLNSNKAQVINFLERHNVHVYMASETWLLPTDDFFLKNYTLHDHRRMDGYAGSAVFFKNSIAFKAFSLPDFDMINAVAATTTNLPVNITFISVYVPAKKKEVPEAVRLDLLTLLKITKSLKSFIIGGDFNAFHHA